MQPPTVLGMLSLLAASAGCGIAVAEAVARWLIRRSDYYVFIPGLRERLILHQPTHRMLEPVVNRVINRWGERGREVPSGPGTFRILVTGGSAAECFTLDQATQWPAVVEALLQHPSALERLGAREIHVGNIGRSAVDSGSLRRILGRVLPQYHRLDLIIIMVGASDVLRWMEAGGPADRPADPLPESALFAWNPRLPLGWAPKRTALAAWARRWKLHRGITQENAASWLGRARKDRANASRFREDAAGREVVTAAFRHHLRGAVQTASEHADRVIVLRQAWFEKDAYTAEEDALFWNGSVGQAYRGAVTEFYSTHVICAMMREVDAAAAEVTAEMGVEGLGLQGRLESSASHFVDHFHATPEGSREIGRLVAEAILTGAPNRTPPP